MQGAALHVLYCGLGHAESRVRERGRGEKNTMGMAVVLVGRQRAQTEEANTAPHCTYSTVRVKPLFPPRGIRLLSSRHHRLKIFAKRIFPRWRALPLGVGRRRGSGVLSRVRHDATSFGFRHLAPQSAFDVSRTEGIVG